MPIARHRSRSATLPAASGLAARLGLGVVALGLGFAVALGAATTASAQVNCAAVRSELASLHNGGGRTGQLEQAYNQQLRELARAQGAFDRYQCQFGSAPQCGSIAATINQMQSTLAQMQRQLARTGGGGNARRIAELERLFATQCGPGQQQIQQALQPNTLLEAIFGIRSQPGYAARRPDPYGTLPPDAGYRTFERPGSSLGDPRHGLGGGGTYRTMCVRTSDGFYFPISFSTTRNRFDQDRGMCAAMCHGVDTALFAYRNPGGDIEDMINTLTGEPYTDQTYAYAYRESFDPNNRCTPSAAVLEDLRTAAATVMERAPAAAPAGPRVPNPSARPDMASDPQTRELAEAGTDFTTLGAMTRPEGEADEDGEVSATDEERVRVVGPNFGYFAD